MKGFDPKFKNFPDYILSITKEIWEDRNIASLHEYYAPKVIVRTPNGVSIGNQNAIAATAATLAELPDRQLLGEDVIWCGNDHEGMLSSHRIMSTATHSADGAFGQASGKTLRYRILADCYAINNAISDEWLLRDQTAIVQQIGWNARDYAQQAINQEGGVEHCTKPLTSHNDMDGPYRGTGNDHVLGIELADLLTSMMSAEFSLIAQRYDRAANLHYAGGVDSFGYSGADQFWLNLRSSLPNAQFTVHHQMGIVENTMPPRAALRWSLQGKHSGWGRFGKPSGTDIYVLGITHAEFGPRGLRREFTLIDDVAIYKQILIQQG